MSRALAFALGAAVLLARAAAGEQEFRLFPDGSSPGPLFESASSPGGGEGDRASSDAAGAGEAESPPRRRCVLFQCRTLPIAPQDKVFTTGVSLWTAAGLLGGFVDGIQGPAYYGFQDFHFTDEGYFQSWTYGGGADKASHFVISATVAGLLYDAYALNGLTPDQAFALSLATMVVSGALVEIGDGLTPYGFSAQDLTADTLGTLAEVLVKRCGADDLVGFRIGKVPTTIPGAALGDRQGTLGLDYSNEIYTMDWKGEGLARRAGNPSGFERFVLASFVFMTKGYGYDPPVPSRYQEVGFEVGLNIPELLKAAGVSDATWWGDVLLRAFSFFRIPYTQVGAYYNLKNHKWYGPGAPYHYY